MIWTDFIQTIIMLIGALVLMGLSKLVYTYNHYLVIISNAFESFYSVKSIFMGIQYFTGLWELDLMATSVALQHNVSQR